MSVPKVKPTYTQLFINNEFVNSEDGATFDTVNPGNYATPFPNYPSPPITIVSP